MSWLESWGDGARLKIHAQPGAKRSSLAGFHGDTLKVKIHAPPVDGKANDELIAFLARVLSCKRSQLAIVSGETSREKTIAVTGMVPSEIQAKLG